jgi:hypothetical protein
MNWPGIVCPHNPSLFASFTGLTVAVRVPQPAQAAEAAARLQESGNELLCIIVESDFPLDEIELPDDLQNIPLAVMAPAWGKFRRLARDLSRLRGFNLRVYLPAHHPQNIAGLRILSSLGIHTCAVLGDGPKDWEALTDLMTYAVLERAPHASMEPFIFIASHYDLTTYLEWGSIYFNDPKHFLHLDADGQVALSPAELRQKRFVAPSLADIGTPSQFPPIHQRAQAWRHFFTDNHPCASCGGWKICLGKFAREMNKNDGCRTFFLEMLEVAQQYKEQKVPPVEPRIWQL